MADYDLAIAGGGMVGASLALLAIRANPHWRIALIDPAPEPTERECARPSFDQRSSALSAGTIECFKQLGIWPAIKSAAGPIHKVHVSDRGHFPGQLIRAADYGASELGAVVPNLHLGRALFQRLASEPGVERLPQPVTGLTPAAERAHLTLADGTKVTAKLVAVADGARSALRARLGISVQTHDYRQHALVANVRTSLPHRRVAFERFTESGPVALLPLADERELALIWTLSPQWAETVLALARPELCNALGRRFGSRLGRFTEVGDVTSYPLMRLEAREQVRSRVVLMGNAAHALHPVAGQGFNLALRDCRALAACLQGADDPGALALLERYAANRHKDQRLTTDIGHAMVSLFGRGDLASITLRHLGLLALELAPPAKTAFARQMMGLGG